ncbi:hypothetical protein FACS189454_07940 [Planctomycetales bacterium]|nr:hypothetical protein FACS189454_07940 [Planctomycetales bacterium]
MIRYSYSIIVVLFLTAFFAVAMRCQAEEYIIHNDVRGVKSTVYLLDKQFISIISNNGEIMVFDAEHQTFTLLDPTLRLQTQIDATETKSKTKAMQQWVLNNPNHKENSFAAFAVKAEFNEKNDESAGLLTLQSHWIDYEFKTVPFPEQSEQAAAMYYDFCDWMCYLNLRLNPCSSMMLTRLTANQHLRSKRKFASHVSAALYAKGKTTLAQPDLVESSHQFSRRLSDADRQQIKQVFEYKTTLPAVPFEEYQKAAVQKIQTK